MQKVSMSLGARESYDQHFADKYITERDHCFMGVFRNRLYKAWYFIVDKIRPIEKELDVEFTQFLFPTGTRTTVWIARPIDVAMRARSLQAQGFKFEIENDDSRIWMSCIDHSTERYVDRYCLDGKDVPSMVDELINDAWSRFIS